MGTELLYRYRPRAAPTKLLENYLWFSHWSQLNDPYDSFRLWTSA